MHTRATFPVANLLPDLSFAFRLISYLTSLSIPSDSTSRNSTQPSVWLSRIIQYSRYLIPEFLMRRVAVLDLLRQLLSYSLAGIMESEFSRISLVCEGSFVVPRNGLGMAKCHNVGQPNQACTLRCAQPELGTVKAGYFLDLWRYIFVVLG